MTTTDETLSIGGDTVPSLGPSVMYADNRPSSPAQISIAALKIIDDAIPTGDVSVAPDDADDLISALSFDGWGIQQPDSPIHNEHRDSLQNDESNQQALMPLLRPRPPPRNEVPCFATASSSTCSLTS